MGASINSSELQSDLAGGDSPLVIDVRKSPAFRAATDMIAGALRREPARVSAWAKELPQASTVVAYCVRGADTHRLDLAPQASGLAAISLGLSRAFNDDHEMLKHGMAG